MRKMIKRLLKKYKYPPRAVLSMDMGLIKRLLKKYKYPPEEAANALETVIRQCEQWSDNSSEDYSTNNNIRKYNFQENSYSIAAEPQSEYNKYPKT